MFGAMRTCCYSNWAFVQCGQFGGISSVDVGVVYAQRFRVLSV